VLQRIKKVMAKLLILGGPLGAGMLLFVIGLVLTGQITKQDQGWFWEAVTANSPTLIGTANSLLYGPINATFQIQAKEAVWPWKDPTTRPTWRKQAFSAYMIAPMFTLSNVLGVFTADWYEATYGGGGVAHTTVFTLIVNTMNLSVNITSNWLITRLGRGKKGPQPS
jgi:hypothetical protein